MTYSLEIRFAFFFLFSFVRAVNNSLTKISPRHRQSKGLVASTLSRAVVVLLVFLPHQRAREQA